MATPLRASRLVTATSLLSLLAACSSSPGGGDAPSSDAGTTSSGDAGSSADGGGKGDSSASTDASASDGGAGKPDGPAGLDGAADALPPLTLPACLGASAPIVLSGTSAYTSVQIGATFDAGLTAAEPFLLDFGSTSSDIDLGAFNPAPAAQNCNPAKLGQACTFSNLTFFGDWGSVVLYTESYASIQGTVRQAGLLATDFLSAQPITLDYKGLRVFGGGASTGFCTDSQLGAAGFAPMTTSGFYSASVATLNALSTIVSGAAAGTSVPNVPTVKIQVGGVAALAQLDTGFDDSVVHHSVNINQAFLTALQAKNPGAITRDASLDLSLSTCVGTSENVQAYHLAAGSALEFMSDGGGAARSVSDAVLFVKNTPTAALVCGGIGTWTVPAAQIATSFYVDAGAMVFDPVSSRVWIPE